MEHDHLLILDLDETLMHAMYPEQISDAINDGFIKDRDDCDHVIVNAYPCIVRPYVHKFLNWAFKNYTVGVWTSATQDYADDVVHKLMIDPQHGEPLFVYASDRCVRRAIPYDDWGQLHELTFIKDLKKLRKFGYSKAKTIIVDDTPLKWSRNYGNLVRVPEFLGAPTDDILKRLMPFLCYLKTLPDVRTLDKRRWMVINDK